MLETIMENHDPDWKDTQVENPFLSKPVPKGTEFSFSFARGEPDCCLLNIPISSEERWTSMSTTTVVLQ